MLSEIDRLLQRLWWEHLRHPAGAGSHQTAGNKWKPYCAGCQTTYDTDSAVVACAKQHRREVLADRHYQSHRVQKLLAEIDAL